MIRKKNISGYNRYYIWSGIENIILNTLIFI